MTSWQAGQVSMNQRLRREITLWEPQRQMMDNNSTYSAHYRAWPIVRQRGQKPKDNRDAADDAPFDTRSTMQDSFQNWRGNHASRSCRPTTSYEPTEWGAPISTTHREAFQKWGVAPRTSFKPKPNDDLRLDAEPFGRSTMQDSYQQIRGFRPTVSAQPKEKPLEYMPFDGTTTSRAAYQPWPVQPRHQRKVPAPQVTMSNNEPFPSTTYRDMFREVRLPPMATSSLGLQVVGGKFHVVMPRGTAPPAKKTIMMTTTLDNQSSVDIVAVLSQSEQNRNGKIVGEFTFDGISPSPKGIPQIEVTFNLDVSNNLRVSAVDLAGNRVRALTVQEKVRL